MISNVPQVRLKFSGGLLNREYLFVRNPTVRRDHSARAPRGAPSSMAPTRSLSLRTAKHPERITEGTNAGDVKAAPVIIALSSGAHIVAFYLMSGCFQTISTFDSLGQNSWRIGKTELALQFFGQARADLWGMLLLMLIANNPVIQGLTFRGLALGFLVSASYTVRSRDGRETRWSFHRARPGTARLHDRGGAKGKRRRT